MAIKSSEIIEDHVQIDGRRWITERHVADDGTEFRVVYMAESKADVSVMLPIRAAQIEQAIADKAAEKQATALAEKERAVELLKLADDSIGKILMVPSEKVADEKTKLADAAAVDIAIDAAVEVTTP